MTRISSSALLAFAGLSVSVRTWAECPPEPALQNFTGGATVVCPCFAAGEEAGVVLDAPADHYPIEILRVGIAWGSQTGGETPSLEGAVRVYAKGLPNPGAPVAQLEGPVLTDGAINEFSLAVLPGGVVIDSGPFTVTLQLANASPLLGPSVVHDGSGCRPGKNVVFAKPGGWLDACVLRVTGNWVMYAVYRRVTCSGEGPRFVRGDANGNGHVDIADVIFALTHLFLGGPALCLDALDANGDGEADISDPVASIISLFAGGIVIPPPYPECGVDPEPPSLGCETEPAACLGG